jgi:UDPglucose 6-dehydrogenase
MIGTGYVGLVSGACLADFGNTVRCVDVDEERIKMLLGGEMPIYEPGLKDLVGRNVEGGRLRFATGIGDAVESSEVVFIAVGTPSRPDGSAELSYFLDAAKSVSPHLNEYKVIVSKSTVPVGTTRRVAALIGENAPPDAEFDVAANPEFLREGSAVEDFMRPNRVVIGAESDRARDVMKKVYRSRYLIETPIVFTDLETAELVKHASNAFLAAKISFINEIAAIAERVGANIDDVAKGMGLDRRIGSKFLHAGVGFGGSCLPKDISSLIHLARSKGYEPRIIEAISELNLALPRKAVEKLEAETGTLEGRTICVLGLAFKPNTADLRDAPSVRIINELLEKKAKVRVFDPVAMGNFRNSVSLDVGYCANAYDAAQGCHGLLLVTEWNEFRELDLPRLKAAMAEPVFIDCRNVYDPSRMVQHGFRYRSFGRGVEESREKEKKT